MYEIGFELGPCYVEVEIDYKVHPGEPMVMYYPNGDGYPGSPPELEVLEVYVTSVSGETYEKTRRELIDFGWIGELDRLAREHIEDNIDMFSEEIFEYECDH